MSAEIVRARRHAETIDVTYRYRLWSAVPDDQRVTLDMVRDRWATGSGHYRDRELRRLATPACAVAVRQPSYRGKWLPCGNDVARGADLCRNHGGPAVRPETVPAPTKGELRAEVERLRALLGERVDA